MIIANNFASVHCILTNNGAKWILAPPLFYQLSRYLDSPFPLYGNLNTFTIRKK